MKIKEISTWRGKRFGGKFKELYKAEDDQMSGEIPSNIPQERDLQNGTFSQSDAIPGACQTIRTDGNSYFVVRNDNSLWAWGYNQNGQLGIGTNTELNGPQQTEPILVMDDVAAVTLEEANSDYVFALKNDGTLLKWNRYFQIFYYTDDNDNRWKLWDGIEEPQNLVTDIVAIDSAGSGAVNMILKSDGTLFERGNILIIDDVKIP